ncbi:DMT family transporter [Guptibacillus hwajinpoensis]|uniref:Drug/metabolite transporter (DMT)-like permease n=1 Tax=Guptibacillus hwajinpoensis TaxID=208199 RepID=A0ABU0JYM9_9BACL|nr:DMT family transporter [Alkalihalobacillus hemicentroti]MDQ0482190.1 drug/metabolite transporter (DMT)-like permease [Alkalihalobacillus hemicentroti]
MSTEQNTKPYVAIIIAVLFVSTSAVFVKLASAPASIIAMHRLLIAILIMLPIVFLKYRKSFKAIKGKDWGYGSLAGVSLAFHFILWFESLNYTSVASSVVLVTLQPLFAFVGTYLFFKEKLTLPAIAGGVTAVMGSIVISWGDFQLNGIALLGDLLALTACAMVTGYLLFGQNIRKRLDLIPYTFIVYGIAAVTLVLYNLILRYPFVSYPASDWVYFILLALFPTLLGHSLLNWAVKWVSVNVISMSILFEPIGASVLAYFILGETLHTMQWIGGGIILAGLYLFIRSYKRKPATINKKRAL